MSTEVTPVLNLEKNLKTCVLPIVYSLNATTTIYKYIIYQSNTTNFNMLFYYLGQHVLTLTKSSSGPSKIQILIIMFKMHCEIPNAYIIDITMYKIQVPLVLLI